MLMKTNKAILDLKLKYNEKQYNEPPRFMGPPLYI